jgi:hypothetical protein
MIVCLCIMQTARRTILRHVYVYSGRTLIRAEYGYLKGSPKKKSTALALNTVLALAHTQMT